MHRILFLSLLALHKWNWFTYYLYKIVYSIQYASIPFQTGQSGVKCAACASLQSSAYEPWALNLTSNHPREDETVQKTKKLRVKCREGCNVDCFTQDSDLLFLCLRDGLNRSDGRWEAELHSVFVVGRGWWGVGSPAGRWSSVGRTSRPQEAGFQRWGHWGTWQVLHQNKTKKHSCCINTWSSPVKKWSHPSPEWHHIRVIRK